ncbi:MAG TPA: acyl-CoA thioesterase [Thermodesulfobacteriota bacterium]|nr:acyl-CoA thioesterase [Thermodesulfobacteriota bacterium]
MPSIKDTSNQMIQFVFPEHANNYGTLHGGRLMNWIMVLGSITSSRIAKGLIVLGTADSIDFLNPVRTGEVVLLNSWVEYIGTSSMEIGVKVESENTSTGEKKLTTFSHLAYVAIDENGSPKKVENKISPADDDERKVYKDAKKRKAQRIERLKDTKPELKDIKYLKNYEWQIETIRVVLPEDAFYGNYLSVGKLMMDIDETGAILARKFTRGVVVTGSVDDVHFYEPIRVGELITLHARINYIGRSSMDIEVNVHTENLTTAVKKHSCTAYLNFVHISKEGRPKAIDKIITPSTKYQKKLWKQSEDRKDRRFERVKWIKNNMVNDN